MLFVEFLTCHHICQSGLAHNSSITDCISQVTYPKDAILVDAVDVDRASEDVTGSNLIYHSVDGDTFKQSITAECSRNLCSVLAVAIQ